MPLMSSGMMDDDRETTKMKLHDELKAPWLCDASINICTIAEMVDWMSLPKEHKRKQNLSGKPPDAFEKGVDSQGKYLIMDVSNNVSSTRKE